MTRKYYNHTLQTNPRQREEETQNTVVVISFDRGQYLEKKETLTVSRHQEDNKSKATSLLILSKMVAKL